MSRTQAGPIGRARSRVRGTRGACGAMWECGASVEGQREEHQERGKRGEGRYVDNIVHNVSRRCTHLSERARGRPDGPVGKRVVGLVCVWVPSRTSELGYYLLLRYGRVGSIALQVRPIFKFRQLSRHGHCVAKYPICSLISFFCVPTFAIICVSPHKVGNGRMRGRKVGGPAGG